MTRSRPQLRSSRRNGCVASGATVVVISAFGSMSLLQKQLTYTTLLPRAPLEPMATLRKRDSTKFAAVRANAWRQSNFSSVCNKDAISGNPPTIARP